MFPGTVTLIADNGSPKQTDSVGVLWEVIKVDVVGLTTKAPDTALVTGAPHVPETIQK